MHYEAKGVTTRGRLRKSREMQQLLKDAMGHIKWRKSAKATV